MEKKCVNQFKTPRLRLRIKSIFMLLFNAQTRGGGGRIWDVLVFIYFLSQAAPWTTRLLHPLIAMFLYTELS